ncbi:MAG TPA: hypothetical protein VH110_01775 [Candidatus Acidoferrum sp.]|jgi:hypothetical protein|nr:hypothetical protein [Candidatus Acidoferrum sp.]
MWDLLKKSTEDCTKFRDFLERSAPERPEAARLEEMLEDLPLSQRQHISVCESCREAGADYVATREIFRDVDSRAEARRPWFAARVMKAIAARQRELANSLSPWSVVPRFASRLAWAAAIVLLAGSTWLYERPAPALQKPPSGAAGQEYLFEVPQPPLNQDDVLVSMAENNP